MSNGPLGDRINSDAVTAAGAELLSSVDIIELLERHGVVLADDDEVTIEVGPLKKRPDPPDKCVTICVGPPFAKVCYRYCT